MSDFYGTLLMFLAACSYGAAAIVIKLAYQAGLQPASLLTLQNLAAVACLWPMMLLSHGVPKLNRRDLRRLACQGVLGNLAISVCYFWAAQRIDVSLLGIILFTYPGLVLLYQIVAEHRPAAVADFLVLVLALAGAVLAADPFRGNGGRVDGPGFLLAVGAAASYAFMNIYGEKLTQDLAPQAITTIGSTFSTLGLMVVLPPAQWLLQSFSKEQWLLIVASALLSTVLPMNLMYLGIRRIGAYHASLVSVAELPCILVLAFIILHERLSPWQAAGGALILSSLVFMQLPGVRRRSEASVDAPKK